MNNRDIYICHATLDGDIKSTAFKYSLRDAMRWCDRFEGTYTTSVERVTSSAMLEALTAEAQA